MKWLRFILSHSFFIAFCAVAMAYQTAQLLKLNVDFYLYAFVFFSTLAGYSFYWLLSSIAFNNNFRLRNFVIKKATTIGILILAILGIGVSIFNQPGLLKYSFTAFLLTFFYLLPLIPIPALNFAKKAGVLKTVILAFTWMYVTAFLPVQKYILHLNALHYLLIANRFLFLLMLCIIFDSRDIDIDKMRGLHSLATDVKKGNLRLVFYCTTITLVLINILLIRNGISVFQSAGLQIAVLATLIAYKCSFQQQGYIFYYFIVDGLMIFSALATFIASI